MLDEKYIKIINKIINKYGKKAQVLQTVEEMSELTKELIKNINRGKDNESEITLEIADVLIMIMQLVEIYNIDGDKILGAMEYKLLRQDERMQNANQKFDKD